MPKHPFSETLRLELVSEDILRVYSRETERVLGVLTKGYLSSTGIRSKKRWFVLGHEYVGFKTRDRALEALRDYSLGTVLHHKAHVAMRASDAHQKLANAKIRTIGGRRLRIRIKEQYHKERVRLRDDLKRAQRIMSGGNTDLLWN